MSERDALFRAIPARPDEGTRRLAFADWLDGRIPHLRSTGLTP